MSVITIPKQLVRNDDLVVIPKKEYEELLGWKNRSFKTVKPTKADLKIMARGRNEVARGDYVTLEELKKELGL